MVANLHCHIHLLRHEVMQSWSWQQPAGGVRHARGEGLLSTLAQGGSHCLVLVLLLCNGFTAATTLVSLIGHCIDYHSCRSLIRCNSVMDKHSNPAGLCHTRVFHNIDSSVQVSDLYISLRLVCAYLLK